MPETFDARRFIADFQQAMNAKNPERLFRHYSDKAELIDPTTPQPVRGRDAMRRNFEQWSSAFGEMDFKIREIVQSAGHVACLYEVRAKHTGSLDLGGGERLEATNKVAKLDVAEFLTIDASGKIARDETIFDLAGMMAQLAGSTER